MPRHPCTQQQQFLFQRPYEEGHWSTSAIDRRVLPAIASPVAIRTRYLYASANKIVSQRPTPIYPSNNTTTAALARTRRRRRLNIGRDIREMCSGVYLPSDPPRGRPSLCVRTGLRVRRAVAADDGRRRSRTTYPDEHRMHRTRLHLAAAHDRLGPAAAAAGLTTAATLRALVHVQLARLHGAAAAAGRGGTTTTGTLYASPHPLHSTTGVRLTIGHPTPPRRSACAPARSLRSLPRVLRRARLCRGGGGGGG